MAWTAFGAAWSLPALSLYAANLREFPLGALREMLFLASIPAAASLGAATLGGRALLPGPGQDDDRRLFTPLAAAMAGLFLSLYAGAVLNGAPRRLMAPAASFSLAAGVWRLTTASRRRFQPDLAFLGAVALAMTAVPAVRIAAFAANEAGPEWFGGGTWRSRALQSQDAWEKAVSPGKPHIFHIVLDSYGRSDVLKSLYDHDNSAFLAALESRGFQVAPLARANYSHTAVSLASMLDASLLEAPAAGDMRSDREHLRRRLQGGRVLSALRESGYGIAALDSGVWVTTFRDRADRVATTYSGNELSRTLLGTLFPGNRGPQADRARILRTLELLPTLAESAHPTFVFAHLLSPHPPFVFGRHGETPSIPYFGSESANHLIRPGRLDRAQYIRHYSAQASFLEARLLSAVDAVLERSKVRPVIIIHGDHGGGAYFHHESPRLWHLQDRFSVLFAALTPEGGRIPSDLALAQAYRMLMPDLLKDPPRPDSQRMNLSSIAGPLRLDDVTDIVGTSPDRARAETLKAERFFPVGR